MNIDSMFPSKYLKCSDLNGQQVRVTIADIQSEKLNDGKTKPILYFRGKDKGLALNMVNANAIADHYGDETENWINQPIILYPAKTEFQGKRVDCIRIKIPPQGQMAAPAQQQRRPAPRQPEPPPPASPDDYGADMNDDVPF